MKMINDEKSEVNEVLDDVVKEIVRKVLREEKRNYNSKEIPTREMASRVRIIIEEQVK